MNCPKCNIETRVKDSRINAAGTQIRRRRICPKCEVKFTTFERRNDHYLEGQAKMLEAHLTLNQHELASIKSKLVRVKNTNQVAPLAKRYVGTGE